MPEPFGKPLNGLFLCYLKKARSGDTSVTKKGEGEKKPIPKCRLILSALMPQFRNYTFSHCGGKISGFRS